MTAICQASETLKIPIEETENKEFAVQLLSAPFPGNIPFKMIKSFEALWKDPGVVQLYTRRNEFQLLDSSSYLLPEVSRIANKKFVPTDQDILRSRIQTTGIIDTTFLLNGKEWVLVDVGGQRSERKKWIHCFEDVTAILFCVGTSEFNETLYEDNKTNRMHEALKLFHEICGSKWFVETAIVLFLNKSDLFKEKIEAGASIKDCFEEYEGEDNYKDSLSYIEHQFTDVMDINTGQKRNVFSHVTCATDTTCVKVVFDAVRDFVIRDALRAGGMVL